MSGKVQRIVFVAVFFTVAAANGFCIKGKFGGNEVDLRFSLGGGGDEGSNVREDQSQSWNEQPWSPKRSSQKWYKRTIPPEVLTDTNDVRNTLLQVNFE